MGTGASKSAEKSINAFKVIRRMQPQGNMSNQSENKNGSLHENSKIPLASDNNGDMMNLSKPNCIEPESHANMHVADSLNEAKKDDRDEKRKDENCQKNVEKIPIKDGITEEDSHKEDKNASGMFYIVLIHFILLLFMYLFIFIHSKCFIHV